MHVYALKISPDRHKLRTSEASSKMFELNILRKKRLKTNPLRGLNYFKLNQSLHEPNLAIYILRIPQSFLLFFHQLYYGAERNLPASRAAREGAFLKKQSSPPTRSLLTAIKP